MFARRFRIAIVTLGVTVCMAVSLSALPLQVYMFNEGIGFPLKTFYSTPAHPGLTLGTEFYYSYSPGFAFFQTAMLGWYRHHPLHQGWLVMTETGWRWTFPFAMTAEVLLGIGYLRTYQDGALYALGPDGNFEKTDDPGLDRFMPSLSLGLGYDFRRSRLLPVVLFVRYMFFLEVPYTKDYQGYEVPALPHVALGMGLRVYL